MGLEVASSEVHAYLVSVQNVGSISKNEVQGGFESQYHNSLG